MRKSVALIIETSSSYGRDLLSGIVQHMRVHGEWSVFLEQRDLAKKPPSWLPDWDGDGIISRTKSSELISSVSKNRVPIVNLTDRDENSQPHVRSDDAAIGRMAAEHLLERGFRWFGFCGFENEAWSMRRQVGFVETITEAGFQCEVFNSPWFGPYANDWQEELQSVSNWFSEIRKPCGVMACNDVRGQHVLDVCSGLELSVPEEVTVIGVDNEELICRLCSPPLSSVVPNAQSVGFQAAELLTRLMEGEPVCESPRLVAPLGIEARQSTDVVAVDDPLVAAALRYIRENACDGISVDNVVRNVAISRSSLERKLRKYLGRTPQQEIRRVQILRVKELLSNTELKTDHIARLCGFEHTEYMSVVFKRVTGITPGGFRKQVVR